MLDHTQHWWTIRSFYTLLLFSLVEQANISLKMVILKHSNYMILGSDICSYFNQHFRLISADGMLLKPSKPATPINKQILQVQFCHAQTCQ